MADKVFAAERTRQAIAAAEKGDLQDARTLLAEALSLDPDYELAWLWFAAVTESPGEEKFCLNKVRDLDPQHKAIPALTRLGNVKPVQPAELAPIIDPPPPEFVTGYAEEVRRAKRARLVRHLLLVAGVVVFLAGIVTLWTLARSQTTYIAMVLTSPDDPQTPESQTAAQAAVDNWNLNEATSRQNIEVVTFFDEGDPARAAQVAQQIVDDGSFVAVIGHTYSRTSEAAAPIYDAAGMPAITPAATADDVTEGRPWYFRTVFDNTQQGKDIALYALGALETRKAAVVATDDSYGRTIRDGFEAAYTERTTLYDQSYRGKIATSLTLTAEADPETRDRELVAAARSIARSGADQIVLATLDLDCQEFFRELDRQGVDAPVLVGDSLANTTFFTGLAKSSPGHLDTVESATPLNAGTLVGPAVTLYDQMTDSLGYTPGWIAGLTYDAVNAITDGLRRGGATWGERDLVGDRTAIREQWDLARTPQTALNTVTGALYFDPDNAAARSAAFDRGIESGGGKVLVQSSPYQISPYTPQAGVSLGAQIDEGWAFRSDGVKYTVQRVVATGFNINQISELDPATQTYTADFFIWFKFEGGSGAPTDIEFVNAADPDLSLAEPERSTTTRGVNYQLFRVKGTFRAPMTFDDFPFDQQQLPVTIQNRTRTAAQITYVVDPDTLKQTQAERLRSGTDAQATIDEIPNWKADTVSFYPSSVGNTGALGDPEVGASGGVTFSQMSSNVGISREVASFLVKNLLPLILLTIVVYFSLWYPYKDAPARITFGVTGILTGAVMLNSVTGSLPQVDYTVAIEWAYYAFILLAGICIVATLIGRHLTDSRQLSRVRTLDRIMRIGYPLYVLAVFLAYVVAFG